MDFQQLMKQASANQSYTQKKHEEMKRQLEQKRKKEVDERRESVRKASALLQEMKRTSEKKEREYRGIVNSRAAEYEKAVARSSSAGSSEQRKVDLNKTELSNGRPHPLATTSGKQTSRDSAAESAPKFKHKTKSPSSSKLSGVASTAKLSTESNRSPTSSKTSVSGTRVKSKSPTSSSSTAAASAPSSKQAVSSSKSRASPKPAASTSTPIRATSGVPPKAPVNFQELMKLAKEKKSMPDSGRATGDNLGGGVKGLKPGEAVEKRERSSEKQHGRCRSASPLGKQLLERGSSRGRQRNGGVGRGERKSPVESQSGVRGSQEAGRGGGNGLAVGGERLRELAQSRVVKRGTGNRPPNCERSAKTESVAGDSHRLPESAILMRERFRKELEASANGRRVVGGSVKSTTAPAKSESFYASSHSQLAKEGRPEFVKKKVQPAGSYQSSWVGEMNEYVERLRGGECEEEEEDDDLDNFVVDDEEGDDVSSAIREIFGYDRRRYRDEEEDDRLMESSFAQQQYEEMRSRRIGRQEDEEDMKRENERLARKRQRKDQSGSARDRKQTKLSFR